MRLLHDWEIGFVAGGRGDRPDTESSANDTSEPGDPSFPVFGSFSMFNMPDGSMQQGWGGSSDFQYTTNGTDPASIPGLQATIAKWEASLANDPSAAGVPGLPGDITVTASLHGAQDNSGDTFAGLGFPFFGANSGGYDPIYSTPDPTPSNYSDAAVAFADNHVKLTGTTADDRTVYNRDHDDIARLFDFANAHPDTAIDIGDGRSVTASQIIQDMANIQIRVTDGFLGIRQDGSVIGAYARQNSDSSITIEITPNSPDTQTYIHGVSGTSGIDFELFHELGHGIESFENPAAYHYNSQPGTNLFEQRYIEGTANEAGRSIENALGIPLLNSHGILLEPGQGYYFPAPLGVDSYSPGYTPSLYMN